MKDLLWRCLLFTSIILFIFINIKEANRSVEPLKLSKTNMTIDEYINSLSLEEKVGQLVIVMAPAGINNKISVVKNFAIGGYIYGYNEISPHTKESLKKEFASYQKVSKVPMLFAIDEEGGTITRLSHNEKIYSKNFASPKMIYQSKGLKGIEEDTIEKSKLLEELGFSINFAPVADVATKEDSYMYQRSSSTNYEEASEIVSTIVKTSLNYNVSYAVKHFPGHGDYQDTHKGKITDTKTLEEYQKKDFLPFVGAIENKAEIIMLDHIIMTSLDDKNPASISKNVINYLKQELNYNGLVMTDCLSMIDDEEKYQKAIIAGNDLIIVKDYRTAIFEIENAVINKVIDEKTLNYHVKRVIEWKISKEILTL